MCNIEYINLEGSQNNQAVEQLKLVNATLAWFKSRKQGFSRGCDLRLFE